MNYKRKLLTEDHLNRIDHLLTHLEWVDGNSTVVGNMGDAKRNTEAIASPYTREIEEILIKQLNLDKEFLQKTQAKFSTSVIISKMQEGDYYRVHQDGADIGDYSTTVFLSSPDNYDGGELDLGFEKVKLERGHAVTYETGTSHCVNDVGGGERVVAVLWTHSSIADRVVREICYKLTRAASFMEEEYPESVEESKDSPSFLLHSALADLQRHCRR